MAFAAAATKISPTSKASSRKIKHLNLSLCRWKNELNKNDLVIMHAD
jgi:hypothetical protein